MQRKKIATIYKKLTWITRITFNFTVTLDMDVYHSVESKTLSKSSKSPLGQLIFFYQWTIVRFDVCNTGKLDKAFSNRTAVISFATVALLYAFFVASGDICHNS